MPFNPVIFIADLISRAALLSDTPERWEGTIDLLKRHGIDPQGYEDFEAGRLKVIVDGQIGKEQS